jgi:ribokinase
LTGRADVAVLGSINLDVVIGVEAFPRAGETIMSRSVVRTQGGKGANQAIAAARMGPSVAMIGALGEDDAGRMLAGVLEENGVDLTGVARLADTMSGVAHVIVDAHGQNEIMVHSGANAMVAPVDVEARTPEARVHLAQLETPIPAIAAFFRLGRANGAVNILNTAPAAAGAEALFPLCDIVVLNETELDAYAGGAGNEAERARRLIVGPEQTVIVTLGAAGALAVKATESFTVEARAVAVVDTTGAGDTFCGVLAASLAEGRPLPEALARANAAAAISVTRPGAGLSAPTRAELEAIPNP